MTSTNVFDQEVDTMVGALEELEQEFDGAFDGQGPSNSVKLSPEEEMLLYDQPMLYFPEEQMTNAQAAQRLLVEKGAQWYVTWVETMEKKRLKAVMK